MPAKPEAAAIADTCVESRPLSHERILTVRTYDPAAPNRAEVDPGAPAQLNANGFGLFDHHAM